MSRRIQVRLHRLDELNLKQFEVLDREKTVVMLPVGMLEIHGQHLPLGTDTFAVDALTLSAAAWLLENDPKLEILLLPTIPYGIDPLDSRRPDMFKRSGSIWLQRGTFKALISDVLQHVIGYGFKTIAPVGFHGGPEQSVVLEEVCLEFRAKHPDRLLFEPVGYVLGGAELDVQPGISTLLGRPLSPIEEVSIRNSVHASMFETSLMLHLRPELVDESFVNLRTIEWRQVYTDANWPGYIGAGPSRADAEIGAAVLRWRGVRTGSVIRKALDGVDISELPRHPVFDDSGPAPEDLQAPPPDKVHIDQSPAVRFSKEDLAEMRTQQGRSSEETKPSDSTESLEGEKASKEGE